MGRQPLNTKALGLVHKTLGLFPEGAPSASFGERTCLKGRQARENPALRTKEQESKHRSKRSSYLWQRKRVTLQLVKPEQARDPVSAGPNISRRTGSNENHSSPTLLENSGPTIDFLHPYFPQTGESTAATWHLCYLPSFGSRPCLPSGCLDSALSQSRASEPQKNVANKQKLKKML